MEGQLKVNPCEDSVWRDSALCERLTSSQRDIIVIPRPKRMK